MKGYQLEAVDTKKVIVPRDVRFVEDETPMEMAVFEATGPAEILSELTSDDLETSKGVGEPSEPTGLNKTSPDSQPDTPPVTGETETSSIPQMSKWASLPT